MSGFNSFAKAIEPDNTPVDKVRGRPERFAEHYSQASLFFNSQTPVERHETVLVFHSRGHRQVDVEHAPWAAP